MRVVTVDLGIEMLGALPTTRAGPGLVMAGLIATGLVVIGLLAPSREPGYTQKLETVCSNQVPAGIRLTTFS